MARVDEKRVGMNVSVTPELARFVQERVESGLYSSASEVVREALRLLHRRELERQAAAERGEMLSPAGERFASALELMESGNLIRAEGIRREEPGLSEDEVQERIRALEAEMETGEGLRLSPERLERLTLREPD